MFDKFDIWKYSDTRNCWDFVREFLIEKAGVPPDDVPKYGIHPDDKKSMTCAANDVKRTFYDCGPVNYAVACHYRGETITHVGVVYNGYVHHTSRQCGTTKTKIRAFERLAPATVYKIHGSIRSL